MHNLLIFCFHVAIICSFSLLMLKIGERALNAWLCVLAICMNLFVTKQIDILDMQVTASDAIAGSYLFGLCLIQEYHGRKNAQMHVLFSFCCSIGFLILSWFHLWYRPNAYDVMQPLFINLLSCMPRLILASLASFIIVQIFDIQFFKWIKTKLNGGKFGLRVLITMTLAHILDTLFFSFFGLYGLVHNIWHVIVFSLVIKIIASILGGIFAIFSKDNTNIKNIFNTS